MQSNNCDLTIVKLIPIVLLVGFMIYFTFDSAKTEMDQIADSVKNFHAPWLAVPDPHIGKELH